MKIKTAFIFIALLIFTTMSYAQSTERNRCPDANLSAEQKNSMKKMWQNFREATKNMNREEKKAERADLKTAILQEIPQTEEQRQALSQCMEQRRQHHKKYRCPDANLSAEQKNSMKKMWQNFREATKNMNREEKKAERADLKTAILQEIPQTEEQRQALSQCMEQRKKRNK